jgi:uncharacterized DUF497 family protein
MRVDVLVWDPHNLAHIARHEVRKEEVEEVLESDHEIRKVWKGRYSIQGQTYSGRYLMVFLDSLGQGRAYVVTAREMTEQEKKRFRRWK